YHACAALHDGSAWCWGMNDEGQLGNLTTTPSLGPTKVFIDPVKDIAAGWDSYESHSQSCAVLSIGHVYCWGSGAHDVASDANGDPDVVQPSEIPFLSSIATVRSSNLHACALATTGELTCWGRNLDGELGFGVKTDLEAPSSVAQGVRSVVLG